MSGLTYGTNGFFLDYAASGDLGNDVSGNANDFTNSNVTQVIDTPTDSYTTLDPLLKYVNVTASKGNLLATPSGTNVQFIGTTMAIPTTGKWVWWAQRQSGTSVNLGIGDATAAVGLDVNKGTNLIFDVNTGAFSKYYSGASQAAPSSFSAPGASLIRFEYDADNDDLYIYDDNVLATTVTGTGIRANAVGPIYPIFGPYASTPATVLANFGGNGLPETPTTGYLTLSTDNLPSQVEYNSAFTWIKSRSAATSHMLFDRVRGAGNYISSNVTAAEVYDANSLQQFLKGGALIGKNSNINTAAATYVAWNWFMQNTGAGVTNTDGSITSTVLADTTAGFSVATYTGTGSAATVGHGLGVAPKMVIVKRRDSTSNWAVYHASNTTAPGTEIIYLNLTNATADDDTNWNDTAPTSSVFSIKDSNYTNGNGATYVAYCWAEIPGFSKFGSYVGNGSADGVFVYTGFTPAFLLVKASSAAGNWRLIDTARDPYNGDIANILYPDLSAAEDIGGVHDDWLSNGFKMRQAAPNNSSGQTYIYMAFASVPSFGPTPAKAR